MKKLILFAVLTATIAVGFYFRIQQNPPILHLVVTTCFGLIAACVAMLVLSVACRKELVTTEYPLENFKITIGKSQSGGNYEVSAGGKVFADCRYVVYAQWQNSDGKKVSDYFTPMTDKPYYVVEHQHEDGKFLLQAQVELGEGKPIISVTKKLPLSQWQDWVFFNDPSPSYRLMFPENSETQKLKYAHDPIMTAYNSILTSSTV